MNKHGCCVIQKCIEKANENEKNMIINNLIKNCQILITDQCGNYIIQFIITLKNDLIIDKIIDILIINIEEYSKQKYSSNVVEKCLELSNDNSCEKIINSLKNENIIINILFNKFGNYVLQKALQRSDLNTQQYFLSIIAPHLYKLKNYSFGLKLYSKLIITYSYLGSIVLSKNDDNYNNNNINNFNNNLNDNNNNINVSNNFYNNKYPVNNNIINNGN